MFSSLDDHQERGPRTCKQSRSWTGMLKEFTTPMMMPLLLLCVVGLLWLKWAGLPPAVLGQSILSKGVETGPTVTQFGPTCAQTMSCLPGACLRRA